jgi:hypothetical protein
MFPSMMRRKAMSLGKGESIIPPFEGVAVIEYADRVQLSPTYWCREFVGLGRIDRRKVDPALVADLHPMLRALEASIIWVIA